MITFFHIFKCLYYAVYFLTKVEESLTLGFSRKELYPAEDIIFFEVDSPGFPVNFIITLLEFSTFFALTPLEIHVFPSHFDIPPWKFLLISSTDHFKYHFSSCIKNLTHIFNYILHLNQKYQKEKKKKKQFKKYLNF